MTIFCANELSWRLGQITVEYAIGWFRRFYDSLTVMSMSLLRDFLSVTRHEDDL